MPQETEVATLDSIDANGMLLVEFEGEKTLLVRDGDRVRAIGALCTHAGGPLAKGVRHGDRIICPWHKAAFCVRTGDVLDPPALDAVPNYSVRIDGQRILLAAREDSGPKPQKADGRHFLIIGAGAAGAVAAQTLRQEGFAGKITMLDAVNRVPYDRTVLSKYALSGQQGKEKSPLQTQAFYQQHKIDRRTGEVTGLDPHARVVTLADGATLNYDAALLATGTTPTPATMPGDQLGHVYTLRSRADADAILRQAERSRRAVILGASFIGMEVAASLRERGLEVTVIGKELVPFAKQLGPEAGAAFVGLHTENGVGFRLDAEITAIDGDGAVSGVRLADGTVIPADLVVVGFGVTPNTAYAEALERSKDGGVVVDAHLRAADKLYAAGDIAQFPNRGDGAPIRVEHWRVAEQQGRVAALNMMGRPTPYDAVPYFWTIQYKKRLDYVGHAEDWDNVIIHGDVKTRDFLAYYVKDGQVAAVAGMGRDADTAALIELFTIRRDWTAGTLTAKPAEVLARL